MSLPLDGERLIPERQFGTRDYRDHIARYMLAGALVQPGMPVLDIACGEGYGTNMLQRTGADAWGADISPRVVAHAKEKYGSRYPHNYPAPAFFDADIRDLPWAWGGKFGLVVCLETIEHVEEWDAALGSLERVRAPGGFLVISTPNKGVYGAGNPYHKREVTTREFEYQLRERYRHVALHRQMEMASSLIVADPTAATVSRSLLTHVDRLPPEMYAIAVCGDGPPSDVPSVVVA